MEPLKIVLLICNIATSECTVQTSVSHFTVECDNTLPMHCIQQGQEELAKMEGLYDHTTQYPRFQLARR
jgi:hypothetical protein